MCVCACEGGLQEHSAEGMHRVCVCVCWQGGGGGVGGGGLTF